MVQKGFLVSTDYFVLIPRVVDESEAAASAVIDRYRVGSVSEDFVLMQGALNEMVTIDLSATAAGGTLLQVSSASEPEAAHNIAVGLATALGGRLTDEAKDEQGSWAEPLGGEAERRRISLLDLSWYTNRSCDQLIDAYYSVLASKYGQKKAGQRASRIAAKSDREGFTVLTSDVLSLGGTVSKEDQEHGDISTLNIDVSTQRVDSHAAAADLQAAFTEIAVTAGAYFATCELVRGAIVDGTQLSIDVESEIASVQAVQGRWMGLPEHPVSWVWVSEELAASVAEVTGGIHRLEPGLTLAASIPASRSTLEAALGSAQFPEALRSRTELEKDEHHTDGYQIRVPARYLDRA